MKKYITRKNQEVEVIKNAQGEIKRCCAECRNYQDIMLGSYGCGGFRCSRYENCNDCLNNLTAGCFKPDPQTS